MMGAMVGVARGKMTQKELKSLLDNPSLENPGIINALPGHGLYLKNVYIPNEGKYLPDSHLNSIHS